MKNNHDQLKYKNPSLPVEERVADLLSKMTLEEKIGQLNQMLGFKAYKKQDDRIIISDKFKNIISGNGIGALYGVLRADPWAGITLKTGLTPKQGAEVVNTIQYFAIENTRLGIPLIFSEECPHGHMAIGATVFPVPISLASTWNPKLIERMASVIAAETRIQGSSVGYGPILDVARDPRWSRVEETFGEDPYLCSQMGIAMVKGFQGKSLNTDHTIIATLKHFAAYGESEGGHNCAPAHIGPRELREVLLPVFHSAIEAGAQSIMASYNEIDGVPCTCNKKLLTDILRYQWNFKGFVVSDCRAVEGLCSHHVANDLIKAAILAIEAGVDIDLGGEAFADFLLKAVRQGMVSINVINGAVSRILRVKFLLGLFEKPYVGINRVEGIIGCKKHRQVSREIAREAIILLKNENNILPLKKDIKSIAVIGPNAHNIYNQLGDYTAPQYLKNIVTVLEGIKKKVAQNTAIHYARGCRIKDNSKEGFFEAIEAVKKSEVAIVVVGGSSARDFDLEHNLTGEAVVSTEPSISDMECGEGFDRSELDLAGVQLDLLKEIHTTGIPMVVVLIKGRPLSINWTAENASAIIDAWYPGQEGGNAIADVLFGDYNPAGRLPISVPKSVGQLPIYYNYKPSARKNYVFLDSKPLFPFGYGLSYTTFKYFNLKITPKRILPTGEAKVSVDITNVGSVPGDEVVQMYIRDEVSSVTRPVKELKGFKRIVLAPGKTKTVTFSITPKELRFLDINMNYIVEPGRFKIMVGGNQDNTLTDYLEVV
jgi:beta-glucosidase